MKYYMITFKGCYGDGSVTSQMIWICQESKYFDADAFKAVLDDEFGEGDPEYKAVIFFMRECCQTEYEVNKNGNKGQSQ